MSSDMYEVTQTLEELYYLLYAYMDIAELGFLGAMLLIAIISAVVTAVVTAVLAIALWITEAIPLAKLGKKLGYKSAYFVWIPILGRFIRLYILSELAGDKPFQLFDGKFTLKNRAYAFWIYVGVYFFGYTLITAIIVVVGAIPVAGQIVGLLTSLLYLVPPVAQALVEFVYMRDLLDLFKPDRKANRTTSVVITALDSLVTLGFARAVYLCTMMKLEPLPQTRDEV